MEEDRIDEDLYKKLKLAEEKFNRKRMGLSNKKPRESKEVTYEDLRNLGEGHESDRTGYVFILNILTMIGSLFCIIGIVVITMIVFMAEDEV